MKDYCRQPVYSFERPDANCFIKQSAICKYCVIISVFLWGVPCTLFNGDLLTSYTHHYERNSMNSWNTMTKYGKLDYRRTEPFSLWKVSLTLSFQVMRILDSYQCNSTFTQSNLQSPFSQQAVTKYVSRQFHLWINSLFLPSCPSSISNWLLF